MTTITAKVIADSVNEYNQRISTLQLRYPRFIHAEFMTHRMFSRNAQSNRAIPVERIVEDIKLDTATPVYWGSNKPGMQAGEEIKETYWAEQEWLNARDAAIDHALDLHEQGLHKQIVNRLLEPFQHINVLVTATEWKNFFSLRDHPDAEPHIQILAQKIKKALRESKPVDLSYDEWHLPYIDFNDKSNIQYIGKLKLISAARCARVSYLTHDRELPEHSKDLELAERLLSSKHMSPFEHVAQAKVFGDWYANFNGWKSFRIDIENN